MARRTAEQYARDSVDAFYGHAPTGTDFLPPVVLASFVADQARPFESPAFVEHARSFARAYADAAEVRGGKPLRLVGLPRLPWYGFAKVELEDGGRLDVFHGNFPAPSVPVGKHDHDFSFCSVVLGGALVSETFYPEHLSPGDQGFSEAPFLVLRKGDGPAEPDGRRARLTRISRRVMMPGRAYRVDHGQVHEVDFVGPTVTLLRKSEIAPKPVTIYADRLTQRPPGRADLRHAVRLVKHVLRQLRLSFEWSL